MCNRSLASTCLCTIRLTSIADRRSSAFFARGGEEHWRPDPEIFPDAKSMAVGSSTTRSRHTAAWTRPLASRYAAKPSGHVSVDTTLASCKYLSAGTCGLSFRMHEGSTDYFAARLQTRTAWLIPSESQRRAACFMIGGSTCSLQVAQNVPKHARPGKTQRRCRSKRLFPEVLCSVSE